MGIVALFCDVDDFCVQFEPLWQQHLLSEKGWQRWRESRRCLSEVRTIVGSFHQSGYCTFKDYFLRYVPPHLRWAFPRLASYTRFVEVMQQALVPLCADFQTRKGRSAGVAFIDSTLLAVCHPRRAGRHKVFGDRGYISQALFDILFSQGVQLITKLHKDMQNKLLPIMDKLLLRKRAVIDTVNDQLKNISQIEHSRHRSVSNFLVNLVAGLIAYTYQPKKPSLHIRTPQDEATSLLVL